MSPEPNGGIGYRLGRLEVRVDSIDERLRITDRLEERVRAMARSVDKCSSEVHDLREDIEHRQEEERKQRRLDRMAIYGAGGTIIAAIIGAVALLAGNAPT